MATMDYEEFLQFAEDAGVGAKVKLTLKGEKIEDAKLNYSDESNYWYICQDVVSGKDEYTLGYKYSWAVGGDYDVLEKVENLRLAEEKDYSYKITDMGCSTGYVYLRSDKDEPKLKTLTPTLKRVLSTNMQKLYVAGYIDDSFEPTSRGLQAIARIEVQKHEVELAKMAQAEIDEAKEA